MGNSAKNVDRFTLLIVLALFFVLMFTNAPVEVAITPSPTETQVALSLASGDSAASEGIPAIWKAVLPPGR
jgi:hypothetical protein